ncbi:MAG: response regulator transcription factor [Deltaproteobacteria bacterium]|nr:response regulator transcription factor [Deltaproteobacteria bacterium]
MSVQEQRRIRVAIVEDHAIVRDGLTSVIGSEPDLEVVAAYASGEEAINGIEKDQPDIVILDMRLPGLDGLATLSLLQLRRPGQRVLIVSSQEGDEAVYRALKSGAVGYVLKKQPSEDLLAAIRAGVTGSAQLSSEVAALLSRRLGSSDLTARELEILRRVANGHSNKEIAAALGISHNTVKNHIVGVMTKLSASDRTHAVTIALQRGLINIG